MTRASGRDRGPAQRTLAEATAAALPGAVVTHPFGDEVDVWKVGVGAGTGRHAGGKMFALLASDPFAGRPAVTLKVDPDRGAALVREQGGVAPGYHMDKRHWVTVALDGRVPDALVVELVEDAYDLVLSTLTARARFEVDPDRFPLPGRHRPGQDA